MMREKAFKVYYTKGLICSSKPVENCTKPFNEKGEKGDTGVTGIGRLLSAGVIRAFILKIWTFFYVYCRHLKRLIFTKKMDRNSKEWRVIYRGGYRHYTH
jgi:hypothetical protein